LGAPGQVGERVADGIDVFDVHGESSLFLKGAILTRGALWPNEAREGCSAERASWGRTAMQMPEKHREHWQKSLRITAMLLALWFFVTFVLAYFARDLKFALFGWPFSFWVGAQGALLVYVGIIAYYAHCMNKLDHEHGVAEDE
jgi:putative solute:sodium symporter small subunit